MLRYRPSYFYTSPSGVGYTRPTESSNTSAGLCILLEQRREKVAAAEPSLQKMVTSGAPSALSWYSGTNHAFREWFSFGDSLALVILV